MTRPSFKTVGRYAAIAVFAASIVSVAGAAGGVRVNMTPSIPLGIYRTSSEPIRKGAYVMFCPPEKAVFRLALKRRYIEPGNCPVGSYPMMKRILAAKNDRVEIGPNGVAINGVIVPDSKPRAKDGAGRPLPRYVASGIVQPGSFIVLGENPVSFDSRYYGPIAREQITTVIHPIVTW